MRDNFTIFYVISVLAGWIYIQNIKIFDSIYKLSMKNRTSIIIITQHSKRFINVSILKVK